PLARVRRTSSSDPAQIAVGPTGSAAATPSAGAGNVTVSATLGGVTGYAAITLVSLATVSVDVGPPTPALIPVGQTVQLSAWVYPPDGPSCAGGWGAVGASSRPFALSVSTTGRVPANAIGSADVTATFGGKTSNAVTVTGANL